MEASQVMAGKGADFVGSVGTSSPDPCAVSSPGDHPTPPVARAFSLVKLSMTGEVTKQQNIAPTMRSI